jgi:hypothetical protein
MTTGYNGEIASETEKYRQLGQGAARENLPPSDAASLDRNESQLRSDADRRIAREHSAYDAVLVDATRGITEVQQKATELESHVSQLLSELPLAAHAETELSSRKMALVNAAETRLNAEAEWRYFRAVHQITEQAVFPDSKIHYLAIVLVLWFVESAMNSVFFAGETGLLGGLVVAIGVSLANMGSAAFFGYCFRYKNLRDPGSKTLGWSCLAAYLVTTIWLNALFGAYRSAYQVLQRANHLDPGPYAFKPAMKAAAAIFFGHMPVSDLTSLILMLVGLGLSVLAFQKGYAIDDKHPGYSGKETRYREAQNLEQSSREALRSALREISAKRISAVQAALREPANLVALYAKRLADLQNAYSQTRAAGDAVKRDFTMVLDAYRHSNAAIRATAPPAYFREYPTLAPPPDAGLGETLMAQIKDSQDVVRRTQAAIQPQLTGQLEALQKEASEFLNTSLPAYFKDIDHAAEASVNRRRQTIARVPDPNVT